MDRSNTVNAVTNECAFDMKGPFPQAK
jgi:hypothetical protein